MNCPNCGAEISGGKFCEKCGALLTNASNNVNSQNSFFDKLKNQANKAATDLLAIKSDFSNGNILFKASKIPSVQEKKIKVEGNECVYFNNGSGYTKHEETFTTTENSFVCYYLKKETKFNSILNISFKSKVKKVESGDEISVGVKYNLLFFVENIEVFFNKLISLKQDTWKVIDINSAISSKLNEIVLSIVTEGISSNGNLDLKDTKSQIDSFNEKIIEKINAYASEFGIKLEVINLDNINIDVNEINKVLIDYLYK